MAFLCSAGTPLFDCEAILLRKSANLIGCPARESFDFVERFVSFEHIEHDVAFAFGFALGLAAFPISFADFFKEVTHDGYPLVSFFILADFFFEQRMVYIFGTRAEEIVHELAEREVFFTAMQAPSAGVRRGFSRVPWPFPSCSAGIP